MDLRINCLGSRSVRYGFKKVGFSPPNGPFFEDLTKRYYLIIKQLGVRYGYIVYINIYNMVVRYTLTI